MFWDPQRTEAVNHRAGDLDIYSVHVNRAGSSFPMRSTQRGWNCGIAYLIGLGSTLWIGLRDETAKLNINSCFYDRTALKCCGWSDKLPLPTM
jgi:hypothetical protein